MRGADGDARRGLGEGRAVDDDDIGFARRGDDGGGCAPSGRRLQDNVLVNAEPLLAQPVPGGETLLRIEIEQNDFACGAVELTSAPGASQVRRDRSLAGTALLLRNRHDERHRTLSFASDSLEVKFNE
jgi:hypothetical protein